MTTVPTGYELVEGGLKPDEMTRGRGLAAAAVVLIATVVCFPLLALDAYTGTVVISIIAQLACAAAIMIKYRGRLVLNLESGFIYGMALQYLLTPALVRILTHNFEDWYGVEAERTTIRVAYPGGMIMVLLFIGVFLLVAGLMPIRPPQRWNDGRLAVAFSKRSYLVMAALCVQLWIVRMALLAAGAFYILNRTNFMFEDSRYSSWAQFTSGVGPVLIAFVWGAYLNRQIIAPVAIGYTLIEFVWNFLSGAREPTLTVPLTALLAFIIYRDRIPWKTMALTIFPILGLIGFMDHYRYALIKTADPTHISVYGITSALSIAVRGAEEEGTGGSALHGLARVNDLESIAAIYNGVPSEQPYLYGETYWRAIPALIPRQLLADKKPVIVPINEWFFRHDGGSSPLTTPGEGYLNFGWIGVMISGLLIGLMVKGVEFVSVRYLWNGAVLPAYIGALAIIARLHTQAISIWVTSLPKIVLMMIIIHLLTKPPRPVDEEAAEAARLAEEYEQNGGASFA